MIQIDMKMPEYCDDCPMLDEYGDYPMCRITQETRGYTFNTRKKRMDKCPMKSVKAASLDKLCEWLGNSFSDPPCCVLENVRCKMECRGFSHMDYSECWRYILTKWMEELEE